MIRFVTLPDPSYGLPYATTDFSSVLQDEHIKAYGSVLDGINYGSTSSLEPLNSGIILSGCDILTSSVGQFVMGFTNSVVYIDGEFYQNDPTYTGSVTIGSGTFYIIPHSTITYEQRNLLDLVTTATASVTRYFKYQTALPTEPYIKFSSQGTSRYYKRVLKYFTSRPNDIYITKSKQYFGSTGVGFNDMEGFIILDINAVGSNLPNLGGRFVRGNGTGLVVGSTGGSATHSITKYEVPKHEHTTGPALWIYDTYRVPFGFFPFGNPNQIQDAIFNHHHTYNTSLYYFNSDADPTQFQDRTPNTNPLSTKGNPDDSPTAPFPAYQSGAANQNTGSMFAYFNRYMDPRSDINFTGGIHDKANSKLQTHRHLIHWENGTGQENNRPFGSPHENRPPYYVVVYYTKKPNT